MIVFLNINMYLHMGKTQLYKHLYNYAYLSRRIIFFQNFKEYYEQSQAGY